jgi:toxin ParE1/3/4
MQIKRTCAMLGGWPEAGRQREEIASGVRSFPVKSYVIFYRRVAGRVQVLRVLHGRRDIPPLFREADR